MAEVDRVESVWGGGVGAAAAGCAGPPPFEPGHARIRVVPVGRRTRRAVQRGDVGAVQLLAAELHAGAQVVPYPARIEVRAEDGVVVADLVGLVLEGRQAARELARQQLGLVWLGQALR